MGWLLSTNLVSGNTAVLEEEESRHSALSEKPQNNAFLSPCLPPSFSPLLLFVSFSSPPALYSLPPPPAQLGVQRHHVQELALSIAPQLTSDTHHAHSTDHTHGRHAPGAISTGRSKRPQYGSHAPAPLGQILHAPLVR